MVPVDPPPTTAVILVALTTLKDAAAVAPKLTEVAPVKLVPVMVIVVPVPAEVGVKLVIVGTPAVVTLFGLFVAVEVRYTSAPALALYSSTITL